MNKLRWLWVLIALAMLVVAGFQLYWLRDSYKREAQSLQVKTEVLFRETVRDLQDSLLQKRFIVTTDSGAKSFSRTGAASGTFRVMPRLQVAPTLPAKVAALMTRRLAGDSSLRKLAGKNSGFITFQTTSVAADSGFRRVIDPDSLPASAISEIVIMKGPGADNIRNRDSMRLRQRQRREDMLTFSPGLVKKDSNKKFPLVPEAMYMSEGNQTMMIRIDSLDNLVPLPLLTKRFAAQLQEQKLVVPFTVTHEKEKKPEPGETMVRAAFPFGNDYSLQLGNTTPYLFRQIALPILFSVLLVGLTFFSFLILYRSLRRQHKLAAIKNEFISNITHELKTPIATVGVAIEALQNFNAINDPQRTREYLSISQNELQRLSLLVDKVLKLSMFEKKEVELNPVQLDMRTIVDEVAASMRLQLEKYNAIVNIQSEGDTTLKGDRLHLLSVVFNLLDNALKYSRENLFITILVKGDEQHTILQVADNGIGISPAYQQKVFEKFFRVPHGDTHNAKGYGLGLSYVWQVIAKHKGKIGLESEPGKGSVFTITLPKG